MQHRAACATDPIAVVCDNNSDMVGMHGDVIAAAPGELRTVSHRALWARDRRIKHLFTPQSAVRATIVLAGYVASIVALLVVVDLAGHLAVTGAASLLIASRLKGLNNIVHECSHRAFSASREFNERVGSILSVVLLTDYASYKEEHGSHHRALGDYARDLDFQLRRPLAHDRPFSWRRVLVQIATLQFLWFYVPRLRLTKPEHLTGLVGFALVLGALVWRGAYHAALALALAHLVFLALHRFVIDIVDHGGIYAANVDELYKSRNFIIGDAVLREIVFPRNDCYHLIHHLYPYLPVASFGEAHALLMEDQEYRDLRHRATSVLARR
jgi:fatty acid desaturase